MDLSRGEEGSPNRVSSPCLSSLRSFFFFLSFLRIVRATLLLSYQNTDFNFEFDERERHVAAKNRINFDEILGSARVQQTYLLLLYLFFLLLFKIRIPVSSSFSRFNTFTAFVTVLFNTCRSIQIDNCKKESRKFRYKRGERVKPRTPRTTYKYIHISFSFFIAIFLYDYTINVITRVKTHSQCCSSSNHFFFFFFFFYNDTRKKRSHCQGCSLFRRIFYRILAIS